MCTEGNIQYKEFLLKKLNQRLTNTIFNTFMGNIRDLSVFMVLTIDNHGLHQQSLKSGDI